tara:strand:+ start:392 stop:943 length:552 start_codon:yes stop_codon:yes gene_type:complete
MVDPVTITAGLVAAKGAISACKAALETADDLNGIGKHLDAIFKADSDVQKQQKQADAKLSHNEKAVVQRIGESSVDEEGAELATIAQQRVAELEHAEALKSLGRALDARFGYGTWEGIVKDQKQQAAKLKVKRREQAERLKQKRIEEREFWAKVAREAGKLVVLCLALGGIVYFLMWAMEQPK